MRFLVPAVLRLVHTVLKVLVMFVCVVCADGMSGAALAQYLPSANDDVSASCPGPSVSEQKDLGSSQDPSDTPSSSTGSTSEEEDDNNDAAGGELATLVEHRVPYVVSLALVGSQRPAEDDFAAPDHNALDPRPPRA